jgi:chromosomal replication initiation ATPase DnaA
MLNLAAQRAIAASDANIDTRIALGWGDPGCGKTLGLEAIAQREDAVLITCGVDVVTPRAIMGKIGEALRIPLGGSMREAFGNVVDRLRGSGKLIIVDEIHALLDSRDDSAFHTLRRLSDQTGVPQLWVATCNLVDQLRLRERKREPLGQIISRIGCQIHLTAKLHGGAGGGKPEPLYTVEQVLAIYGANELRLTRDAARFLARLCTNPMRGLLRTCTGLVMHATTSNRLAGGGELTAEMLWEAARFLFQESVVAAMENELREEIAAMPLRLASA